MEKNRPVFLNLMQIKLPAAGLASILHRVSGVLLFLFLPIYLWMLEQSLYSAHRFHQLKDIINFGYNKCILWSMLTVTGYHFFAGIRHLLMDIGIGESKRSGTIGAYIVFGVTVTFAVVVGICL